MGLHLLRRTFWQTVIQCETKHLHVLLLDCLPSTLPVVVFTLQYCKYTKITAMVNDS